MKLLLAAVFMFFLLAGGPANADDKALAREANAALAHKDFKTAFTKFSILAEHGEPAAQFNLGAFYLNGQGTSKDEKRAFEWFRKSAALGNSRARQVIEKAAARGNESARNELKILQGQVNPEKAPAPPKDIQVVKPSEREVSPVKPVEKPAERPLAQTRSAGKRIYGDPTVASSGKWVYGISAGVSSYKATEPMYYPTSGGVLSYTASAYSAIQPGVGAWIGYGDIAVMLSYGRRSKTLSATVQGVGTLSKTFKTSETEIVVRWLARQLAGEYFMPYVLAGYARNSTTGTEDEIQFQDVYSQRDSMLMLGAGTIVPVNDAVGFRIDGRLGSDKQVNSGRFVASPGVTLSFDTYQYTATARFSRITAAMYFRMAPGWDGELAFKRGSYAAGVGPSYSDSALYATVEYVYR